MSKLKLYVLLGLIISISAPTIKADEGMWLLQLMQEQHSIDMMKKLGLKLEVNDLYNPNGVSIKDAVGIFGGGCTGEVISPEGLILTNHHCGYSFIQQHSSVEHDYLTHGFWAKSREEELATPHLKFTFIERIEDITDIINEKISAGEITEIGSFSSRYLNNLAKELHAQSDLKDKKGIVPQALPFYAGNKFYLIYKKEYTDVRMVAAPPSSVGKFGGETDNWMWPRHTGDFSMFRIYADKNGEPAEYSAENIPLKTKKHLSISLKGVEEGDYAMIMGFPGSTSRYLTVSEVQERMEATNSPRIRVRETRQEVLKKEMNESDKIRIQYANKYASSSNYWKNSIGMNKAIVDNNVLGTKATQEAAFLKFAQSQNNKEYTEVVSKINEAVSQTQPLRYQFTSLLEALVTGIEFRVPQTLFPQMKEALEKGNTAKVDSLKTNFQRMFNSIHNKDYDHEVDRKVALELIPLYAEMIQPDMRPTIYTVIADQFDGSYSNFVNDMYNNSIMASKENLDKFLENPTVEALDSDLAAQYFSSVMAKFQELNMALVPLNNELSILHKTYIRGLSEMKLPTPSYPDANFTIRLTYGSVKSYRPRDGVRYKHFTTTRGIFEKENPESREFTVPQELKELIKNKDFGRYAMPNGEMPVCFLSTNDITGGNSGSPVLNGRGELIGCAFDGNWESLSGDINFDDNMQRCINVDIRYILFILEKLGGCGHLVDEMTIVE
ncbi:S46 family peptidase [Bacteroides sp. OttesenSCG-928-D19]|nr:S46 family peptidase [Bacteroides sp. OttesenSCG-928-D19]